MPINPIQRSIVNGIIQGLESLIERIREIPMDRGAPEQKSLATVLDHLERVNELLAKDKGIVKAADVARIGREFVRIGEALSPKRRAAPSPRRRRTPKGR